jgi:hypothetical protein
MEPMVPDTHDWLDGLRQFAADHRQRKPLADPTRPTPELAAERAILTTHLVSWLDDFEAMLAARRAACRATSPSPAADPDPAIVLTTSADELFGPGHPLGAAMRPRMAFVTELEYRLWCIRHPDDAHLRHVNHWNWIKSRVPERRSGEFARHPLGADERYWLHRTGTAGAGAANRRDCHLWKWNGRAAALLQAFIREGSVSHFDPSSPEAAG